MKKIIRNLGILLLTMFVFAFAIQKRDSNKEQSNYINVSVAEFQDLIQQQKGIVLDVRTPKEIAKGYIKGAQFLDFYQDNFEEELLKLSTKKPVYIYCKSGGRSKRTAILLSKHSNAKVYNLLGGFSAWKDAQLPFETK